MPRYLIEKRLAQRLELPPGVVLVDDNVEGAEDMDELFEAFFGAGELRHYCLYETRDPEVLMAAARNAGVPTDAVVECDLWRQEE